MAITIHSAPPFKLTNKSGKTIFFYIEGKLSAYQSLKNGSSVTSNHVPLDLYIALDGSLKEIKYSLEDLKSFDGTIDSKGKLVTGGFMSIGTKTIKPVGIKQALSGLWFNQDACIKLGVNPEDMTPKEIALAFIGLDTRKTYAKNDVENKYKVLRKNWADIIKTITLDPRYKEFKTKSTGKAYIAAKTTWEAEKEKALAKISQEREIITKVISQIDQGYQVLVD